MKRTSILALLLFFTFSGFAQVRQLEQPIKAIIDGKNATIGIALVGADGDTLTINGNTEIVCNYRPTVDLSVKIDATKIPLDQITGKSTTDGIAPKVADGNTLTVNGSRSYPTLSVYKFYLALAVLSKVDEGKLSLDQKVFVRKEQLHANTYSPLRDDYPNGDFSISLGELLRYTVAKSDNNGCDILFELVGGTAVVDEYIKRIGIDGIAVKATEAEMHNGWEPQYTNTSTPFASVQLLEHFYNGKLLSEKSKAFLWETMTGRTTGMDKIKGLLPNGTTVAHKSGMSDRNAAGLKAADNDIAIVVLPDGRHFTLAVFVSNSTEDDKTNIAIIANVAKCVWDFYVNTK